MDLKHLHPETLLIREAYYADLIDNLQLINGNSILKIVNHPRLHLAPIEHLAMEMRQYTRYTTRLYVVVANLTLLTL
jgi:hypothetical protein